jgi:RNA polymerase sigma-70 factor, ECF subfamily
MSNITEGKKQPKKPGDDDLKYVVLCRKGDTDAFAILVERHQKKMLNIACRMMGDYDEACDIVQEAFLSAYRSINKFKAEALFSTWLYRIVVNQAKNRLRQIRRLKSHEEAAENSIAQAEDDAVACADCKVEERADEQLIQKEREAKVQKCISGLEDEFREVLVLRDIQGFSYEEITGILQLAEGTVKSRLSRARNFLKDCLLKAFGEL